MSLDTACEKPMKAAMSGRRPSWAWFMSAGEGLIFWIAAMSQSWTCWRSKRRQRERLKW